MLGLLPYFPPSRSTKLIDSSQFAPGVIHLIAPTEQHARVPYAPPDALPHTTPSTQLSVRAASSSSLSSSLLASFPLNSLHKASLLTTGHLFPLSRSSSSSSMTLRPPSTGYLLIPSPTQRPLPQIRPHILRTNRLPTLSQPPSP